MPSKCLNIPRNIAVQKMLEDVLHKMTCRGSPKSFTICKEINFMKVLLGCDYESGASAVGSVEP